MAGPALLGTSQGDNAMSSPDPDSGLTTTGWGVITGGALAAGALLKSTYDFVLNYRRDNNKNRTDFIDKLQAQIFNLQAQMADLQAKYQEENRQMEKAHAAEYRQLFDELSTVKAENAMLKERLKHEVEQRLVLEETVRTMRTVDGSCGPKGCPLLNAENKKDGP